MLSNSKVTMIILALTLCFVINIVAQGLAHGFGVTDDQQSKQLNEQLVKVPLSETND